MAEDAVIPISGQQLQGANQFELSGSVQISYSTTSVTGRALFSYKGGQVDLQFMGDEIGQTASPVGDQVTVTFPPLDDGFDHTFTLLVPRIRTAEG